MTTSSAPQAQLLIIQVERAPHLIHSLEDTWTTYEGNVNLPFEYEERKFEASEDAITAEADCRVDGERATIRVKSDCLSRKSCSLRSCMTLHVSAFLGPLRELYRDARDLRDEYWYVREIAHWLGYFMYEVDAEISMMNKYPSFAADRAAHYVRMEEKAALRDLTTGWKTLESDDPECGYHALGSQLCSELAGVLTGDADIERRLCDHPTLAGC